MSSVAPIIFFFNGSFVRRDTGFHWRSFSLLKYLIDTGRTVIVYCYADHPIHPWSADDEAIFAASFPDIPLILERRPRSLKAIARFKKLAVGLLPRFAREIASFGPRRLTPRLAQLKDNYKDAVFIISHVTATLDVNGVDLERCVIDVIDLHFVQIAKRFQRPVYSLRSVQSFRCEMSLLDQVGGIISLATPDTGMLRLCLGNPVMFIADYGNATPWPSVSVNPPQTHPTANRRLLFVGSDNPFNVAGINRFIREHGKLVEQYGLDIVGKVSLDTAVVAASRSCPNISLLGFIDDLSDCYAKAKAVVSPVDGTGIKIKVLEALAMGVPVFGSPHTIEGLPAGHEACVYPIDQTMSEILDDAERLRKAGEAALVYSQSLTATGDLPILSRLLDAMTGVPLK